MVQYLAWWWLYESKHVDTLIDNKLVAFWLNLLLEFIKDVVQLQHENVYSNTEADPDNQRPDKWSYTVHNCDLRSSGILRGVEW